MRFPLPTSPRVAARSAAALLVAAGLVAGAALPASASSRGDSRTTYVALGDSYAAGQGGGPYLDTCHHTSAGYVDVLDAKPGIDLVAEPSCAGATTADVLSRQIASLDRRVELVTITVGGNDANFIGVASACLPAPESPACAAALAKTQEILTTPGLYLSLRQTFAAVAAAAPRARIVVTAYPMPFGGQLASTPAGQAINRSTVLLDGTIAAAVASVKLQSKAKITLVGASVVQSFSGHAVGDPVPWITGLDSPDALHPNALGYKAYGELIYRAIR